MSWCLGLVVTCWRAKDPVHIGRHTCCTTKGQGGVLGPGFPRGKACLSVSCESDRRFASVCHCTNRMGVRAMPNVA